MLTISDTHALVFWGLEPDRLSGLARETMARGREEGDLACCDISFWEVALLFARGRLTPPVTATEFMHLLTDELRLSVLPITPEIATLSQSDVMSHKDPADRLIAATALHHRAPLVTADDKLHALQALHCVW